MRPDDLAPGSETKVTNTGWGGGTDSSGKTDRGRSGPEPEIDGNKLTTGYETQSTTKSAPERGTEPSAIETSSYTRGDIEQSQPKPRRINDRVRRIDPKY